MTGISYFSVSLLLVVGVSACSSEKKSSSSSEKKMEPTKTALRPIDEPTVPGSHLPFFNEEEVIGNLQGTWVFDTDIISVPWAWSFDGRDFVWHRIDKPQMQGSLDVLAPCLIGHVDGGVAAMTNYRNIVATKDGLFTGSSMGERKGTDYVVCTFAGVFAGTAEGCSLWTGFFEPPTRKDASCRFEKGPDGTEFFYAESGADAKVKVQVFGDVISSWALDQAKGRRVSDIAEAAAILAKP